MDGDQVVLSQKPNNMIVRFGIDRTLSYGIVVKFIGQLFIYSNYIFIINVIPGFNILCKDNGKTSAFHITDFTAVTHCGERINKAQLRPITGSYMS